MIVFELSMPGKGSWNGKWTEEGRCYVRTRSQRSVPKDAWNKSFRYRWDDGWEACVTVTQMPATEARKLERHSVGFAGYDWMIRSIIKYGKIMTDEEIEEVES